MTFKNIPDQYQIMRVMSTILQRAIILREYGDMYELPEGIEIDDELPMCCDYRCDSFDYQILKGKTVFKVLFNDGLVTSRATITVQNAIFENTKPVNDDYASIINEMFDRMLLSQLLVALNKKKAAS